MKKVLARLLPIQWAYKPMGICPVQAEGYFLGYYFFFRGRWDSLTIEFANSCDDWFNDKVIYWKILKTTDGIFNAGYYQQEKCIALIYRGCLLFLIYKIFKIKL